MDQHWQPFALLRSSGETAELVRTFDWSRTPLGPIDAWPRALVSYVSMMLRLPTPAIIFWGDDQIQIYNDGYARIMGPRHPKYFGAPYRECWPDTYPLIYPWMRNVLDHGEIVRVDKTCIPVTRYGFEEDAYFTFTFSALHDDNGRITGIYQPVNEVTDVVLAERRSETLRALVPHADSDDPLQDVIAALSANRDDIRFAVIHEWNATEGRFDVLAQIGDIDAERIASFATHRTTPERVDNAYVVPLRHSEQEPLVGVAAFGISERLHFDDKYRNFFETVASQVSSMIAAKRRADAAAELERATHAAAHDERMRLYTVLMNAPGLFVLLRGEDFVIELVNHACLRAWGRDETITGKPLLEALPELRDQAFPALLGEVRRTGVARGEKAALARLDKNGDGQLTDVYFDFMYEPLRDPSGAITSVIAFAVDVTHQVVAQRAIEGALDEARRANRAKDEFLALLGHELRNPMAPIVAAVDVMKHRGDASVTREREIIERQSKHLVRLIDDLLDVSRIARGAIELSRSRCKLDELIARSIETAAPLFEQKQHRLTSEVPADLIVDVDPDRMHQVFTNLLTNAAKYTPRGGQVHVQARRDGDKVSVMVRDNGAGISGEMLPRIFEAFVQERQGIDRSQGGLGLGLSIVRAIVRHHGGDVTARSEGAGRGTEVEVRLRLATANDAESTQQTGRHRIPSARRRVLIVDDNMDAAALLADAVAALGHEARVAHEAATALKVTAEGFSPDVALLDLGLPVVDGYELARQLRAYAAGIRLVAVTGYGQDSDREQSKRAGFEVHMVKPVDIAVLAATIEQLMGG